LNRFALRFGRKSAWLLVQSPGPIDKESVVTHPETAASSDLAQITTEEFASYFRHMALRVDRAARSVSEDRLWTKPFPFGNSIGHLVLHLTGNLNHYIGGLIGGSGYVRDRDNEFVDPERYPLEDLLSSFHQAVDMVVRTLVAQNAESLALEVTEQPPVRTRLGLFLVCAAHLNNHIGQMSYLVQALQTNTREGPTW
jgi:hypothetical protein